MRRRHPVRRLGRTVLGAVLLLVLGLLGPGCGEPEDGLERVSVVGSTWYGHVPVWVGMEEGIFERFGFRIDWQPVGKSMDRLIAIQSNSAHFASLGEISMLSAMAQGMSRFYWVGNQDIAPGFEGLVAQPGIETIEDLRGKKVGFPFASSVDLTCRLLLRQHGLEPQRDVELINLETGDVPTVFRNGHVDAALVWEPGFSKLRDVEGATVLGMDTDTEVYKRFGTMTGPDVLILSRKWADEDRERARRFMAAYFLAVEWVKQNPEATVKLVAGTYIPQKEDVVRRSLSKFVWHGLDMQREIMSDAGIYGQARYVSKMLHEDLQMIREVPDFEKWVDLDLLPAPAGAQAPDAAGPQGD